MPIVTQLNDDLPKMEEAQVNLRHTQPGKWFEIIQRKRDLGLDTRSGARRKDYDSEETEEEYSNDVRNYRLAGGNTENPRPAKEWTEYLAKTNRRRGYDKPRKKGAK